MKQGACEVRRAGWNPEYTRCKKVGESVERRGQRRARDVKVVDGLLRGSVGIVAAAVAANEAREAALVGIPWRAEE